MIHIPILSSLSGFRYKASALAALLFIPAQLLATFTLEDARISPAKATDGQTVTVEYRITSPETTTVSLELRVNEGFLRDTINERTVTLREGTHWYERPYRVILPPDSDGGVFDARYVVNEVGGDRSQNLWRPGTFEVSPGAPLTVPILSYNKIGPERHNWFWISTDTFRSHMKALSEEGYTTVTLQDVMNHRAGLASLPSKPIVISFLNGYRLHKDVVDPILDEFGFVATNFIPPHHIGGTNAWDEGDNDPEIPHLTWNEIRAMEASGRWDFQATGNEHVDIDFVDTRTEVRLAKEKIETELDKEVLFFSYPFGVGAEDINNRLGIFREGYLAAFSFREGYVSLTDKWAFPRFDMHHSIHVDPHAYPSEWYLFGPNYLGSGTAMPKPHFEAYPDDGSLPGTHPNPPGDDDPDPSDPPPAEFVYHPADTNEDRKIDDLELSAYAFQFLQAEHSDDLGLSRAAYIFLQTGSGAYIYDPENGEGANAWMPNHD